MFDAYGMPNKARSSVPYLIWTAGLSISAHSSVAQSWINMKQDGNQKVSLQNRLMKPSSVRKCPRDQTDIDSL